MDNLHLAVQFFLQIGVILLACRLVGVVALRLGQPQVVAEMITGVLWGACGLVFAAAVIGKGGACWAAARVMGMSQREALGIGALMNARGLMELIIINIGLQRGVISAELFATLVIMAVLTTLMASPLFDRLIGPQVES